MSWWNFKGDAKNLFGNPTAPETDTNAGNPPEEDAEKIFLLLAPNSLVLIEKWCSLLEKTVEFPTITGICNVSKHFLDGGNLF
jgi:hypothetical protein